MNNEGVANLSNSSLNQVSWAQQMEIIPQETIFAILVVIGIIADTAIIYTVFCFKRTRTAPNIFLANWAIADASSLIVTPSSFRAVSRTDDIAISREFVCLLFQADLIFQVISMGFLLTLLLDWCIAANFPRSSVKFRNYYKVLTVALWIFALLLSSWSIRLCIRSIFIYFSALLFLFEYCTLLIFVIALNCFMLVQKCKKKTAKYPTLMLTLASVCTTCWFPGFINFFLLEFESVHPTIRILAECFIFSSPPIIFILLYLLDKDFAGCFLQILKPTEQSEQRCVCPLPLYHNNVRNSNDTPMDGIILENLTREISSASA